VSSNNFPTAAGLASSAAGFAALVRAIADLYELPQSPQELSKIARQGSGSACRSLLGGYVAWRVGDLADGSDSLAEEVSPASHWPDMRALILVVSAAKKDVPSTEGMQATVKTSLLFETRVKVLVPQRMIAMENAIKQRDFESFAEVTMRDSNNFHATCEDTWPPIFYLNDVSRAAIRLVENINKREGRMVAAYTFDAGPNAVIFHLAKDTDLVAGTFKAMLGGKGGWDGERGNEISAKDNYMEGLDMRAVGVIEEGVSRVILTGVGEGPVKTNDHLVGEDGQVLSQG
jgi:diphosphomevalonate decarboxylase